MLQDYTKDEKFVKIVDSRRNGYVERLKKLEIIVSYLESAIKDIDEQVFIEDAPNPTTEWGKQLTVCQNNCYALHLQLELIKKERQAEAFGMTEELQNEIDTLRCDIEEEKRRQEEVADYERRRKNSTA